MCAKTGYHCYYVYSLYGVKPYEDYSLPKTAVFAVRLGLGRKRTYRLVRGVQNIQLRAGVQAHFAMGPLPLRRAISGNTGHH